jgi:hypothetical protein
MSTDSKSVLDDLDKQYAPAWKPEPGDKVAGIVVDQSEWDAGFGRYPILTLRTEEGEIAIHAFHEVLQSELARIAPKEGDLLGVKYVGKDPDKGYHRYRVRRSGEGGGVEWSKYADALDDDRTETDVPVDTSDLDNAKNPDDEIPF